MASHESKNGGVDLLFGDFNIVEEEGDGQPAAVRDDRALISLEVAFQTPEDAVRAYSENVGVGQLTLATNQTLRKGTELTVRVRVPGWNPPLLTSGKVTWSRPDAMGIAFTALNPPDREQFRKLVLANTTMVERMRRQFSRQVEQPAPAAVTARKTTLVQLQDEMFSDVLSELLNDSGYVAISDPASGSRPNIIVADPATAEPMQRTFKAVPLVLVNASGPNELARLRMMHLRARAYVPRPASAAKVLQAINQVFQPR